MKGLSADGEHWVDGVSPDGKVKIEDLGDELPALKDEIDNYFGGMSREDAIAAFEKWKAENAEEVKRQHEETLKRIGESARRKERIRDNLLYQIGMRLAATRSTPALQGALAEFKEEFLRP